MRVEHPSCDLEIDIQATRSYYKKNETCTCCACRLFHEQVAKNYPKLTEFLERMGIDVSRPDDTGWFESGQEIEYNFVGYTVCGKLHRPKRLERIVEDGRTLEIVMEQDLYLPNNQEGPYFVVMVYNVVLDKTSDESCTKAMH